MADDTAHPRPDQAEEPVEDIGASNVDLDQARHDPAHPSPAVPEPGHDADADHGHDDHDDHGDHPVEDPRWVLAPLLVGLVIGIVLVVVLGLASGAEPVHTL